MVKFLVSVPYNLYVETKEHLFYNGYHFIWDDMDVLEVDEDEAEYVKTILHDRGIGYVEV